MKKIYLIAAIILCLAASAIAGPTVTTQGSAGAGCSSAGCSYSTGSWWTFLGTPWTSMGYVTGTPWTSAGYQAALVNQTNIKSIDGQTLLGSGDLVLNGWKLIPAADYTSTPASTSTITFSVDITALNLVGLPVQYVIGGTTYYGLISALTSSLMTIKGISLSGTITALYYGPVSKIQQHVITIPNQYETATSNTLVENNYSQFVWKLPAAYIVSYSVYSYTADSGTKGQVDLVVNGNLLNNVAGGLTVAAAITRVSTTIDINPTYYQIQRDNIIDVSATKNGNGDASFLTVTFDCVFP